jgi:hypothetical protein
MGNHSWSKDLLARVRFGKRCLPLVLLAIWPACSMAQDKHIDVTVRQEGAVHKLVFLNSECPDRAGEMGCVMADHGNSPNISWQLDDAGSADWILSRLQFSPDGSNWGDPSHPLTNCTVEDFRLTESDRSTGLASSAQIVSNGRMLKIRDGNRNVCVTHYRLYAMPRAGGMEIDSDPVIDNRGGGRN